MKQKNEFESTAQKKNPDSKTAWRGDITPAARDISDSATINFYSTEFSRTDDLNDCSRDYQSFEGLDGIVTAHERHVTELRRQRDIIDLPQRAQTCPSTSDIKPEDPGPLERAGSFTVISEGRTLIIDADEKRAIACGKTLRNHRLPCTLLITGSTVSNNFASGLRRTKLLHVESASVMGAFGQFSARVTIAGNEKPLTEWFDDADIFDLVLDLQSTPSFTGGRPPVGYCAPGSNPAFLEQAMKELPEMRGRFKKPQFVVFEKDRCFHGRSRTHDCRRCLEICPVGSIRSMDSKISINHSLCQGCGSCALICPSDAFRVVQPSQEELLNSLQSSLKSKLAEGVSSVSLIIFDSETVAGSEFLGMDDRLHTACFKVEQIAHVRLEMLLFAVASGASEVLVACDPQNPPAVREAVRQQVEMARAILRGFGLGEERIQFWVVFPEGLNPEEKVPRQACIGEQANDAWIAPMTFPNDTGRRTLVHRVAMYLQGRSGVQQSCLSLPKGSPFGTVAVNADACTLCMACVVACPSAALSSGDAVPRLLFREFRCHQCGLCRDTCPEGAIQLIPRLLLGKRETENQAVLREMEPFRCVECGAPFAPPVMIGRIREKLAGHWMYATEQQRRRLQMCGTCRTRDMLTSRETGLRNS